MGTDDITRLHERFDSIVNKLGQIEGYFIRLDERINNLSCPVMATRISEVERELKAIPWKIVSVALTAIASLIGALWSISQQLAR